MSKSIADFFLFFVCREPLITNTEVSIRQIEHVGVVEDCRDSMIYGKPVILVSFVLLFDMCQACPTLCVCKWKSGKQTVECNNRNLLIIPDGMDSGTQVLEFNGNNLHILHNEKFRKLDLINLQRIYLARCHIKIIEERTFRGLTNLIELDLSGNMLENVPSESFHDCPSLMRLTLSDNPIKTLRKAAFNHLSFLSTLELSNCELSRVDENAFQGLMNLEWLHLDRNKLTSLKGLSKSLKGIDLQNNLWECDCNLQDLHEWMLSINIAFIVEPVCNGPTRLAKQTIKSIPQEELACLPDVSPTTFYLEIGEGKNISLLCNVKAIPPAKVSWWFQGQLLQNDSIVAPGLHLLYYIEEGLTEKQSELMIFNANSEDNGTFICSAENAAGIVQSNFTIRVVIKQISEGNIETLAIEQILILMSVAAISVLILLTLITISVIKCCKKRKCDVKIERENSVKQKQQIDSEEVAIALSPNKMSPMKCFNEQNPDLINGVEKQEKIIPPECNLYSFSTDVHLNPVSLFQPGCYRTLPHNNRISKSGSSIACCSREAEFIVGTNNPQSYEHYYTDVRYTVDGYPAKSSPPWPIITQNKKTVGAQTQTDCEDNCGSSSSNSSNSKKNSVVVLNKPISKLINVQDTLTESPDEGYEGESMETNAS